MPLGARTFVGDGVGGATVAPDGTVDWCCPWAFAGPALCSALLDPLGGALRVGPVRAWATGGAGVAAPPGSLGQVPGTGVSSLRLVASGGRSVEVTDLVAAGRLVRVVRCLAGPVDVEVEYRPPQRPVPPRRVVTAPWGVVADRVAVRSGVLMVATPLGRDDTLWRGVRRLDTGEVAVVTLGALDVPALRTDEALALVDDAVTAWRWAVAPVAASVGGPYASAVERAVIGVLSLRAPGGAPMAAGTTSLPRWPGAERSADSRFVRLRDAATTARLAGRLGLADVAADAESWLRTAVDGATWPWAAFVAADASAPPPREEVPLAGWRGSGPVVRGRSDPADLGLFGEVVAAVSASTGGDDRSGAPGGPAAGPLTGAWPALVAAADRLAATPGEVPSDGGAWGLPSRAHTSTLLAVSAGLERMARMARAVDPLSLDAATWQLAARSHLAAVERSAVASDGALRMVASSAAPDWPDAALLQVAWTGPWPPRHPIVVATVDRVGAQLGDGPWVRRYGPEVDDGVGGADGADVEATCWAVRAEAALGRWEEAHARMDAVVAAAPLLLSAAVDPVSGQQLGDLPATGAALALAEAALALAAGPS